MVLRAWETSRTRRVGIYADVGKVVSKAKAIMDWKPIKLPMQNKDGDDFDDF